MTGKRNRLMLRKISVPNLVGYFSSEDENSAAVAVAAVVVLAFDYVDLIVTQMTIPNPF